MTSPILTEAPRRGRSAEKALSSHECPVVSK
jgi:hypothetical protein